MMKKDPKRRSRAKRSTTKRSRRTKRSRAKRREIAARRKAPQTAATPPLTALWQVQVLPLLPATPATVLPSRISVPVPEPLGAAGADAAAIPPLVFGAAGAAAKAAAGAAAGRATRPSANYKRTGPKKQLNRTRSISV